MASAQILVHKNLPLLEVEEKILLDILLADPQASRLILRRLSDQVAVVEPGQVDNLQARLLKLGHLPKMVDQ